MLVSQVVAQVFEFVEDAVLVLDSFREDRSDGCVETRATIADYQLEQARVQALGQ